MNAKSLIYRCIKESQEYLTSDQRYKSISVLILTILNSFLDLIGLAALLPLFGVILTKGFSQEYVWVGTLMRWLNISSENFMIAVLSLFILFILVSKNVIGIKINQMQNRFVWDVYQSISNHIMKKAYKRGSLFFKSINSNDIVNDIIRIPKAYVNQMLQPLILYLNEIFILALIAISLLIYDAKIIVLLAVSIGPFFALFYYLVKRRLDYIGKRLNELGPKLNKPVFELIFGYWDMAISDTFDSFSKEFDESLNESKKLYVWNHVLGLIPMRIMEISILLSVLIMVLYGVFYMNSREELITLLSVFGLAAYRTIPSLNRMMLALMNIRSQLHVFEVFKNYKPFYYDENTDEVKSEIQFSKKVVLQDLSFYFKEDEPIIRDINATIYKGDVIGIVGKSGSGKSTLINVFLRFLTEKKGSISVDGQVLNDCNIKSWRSKIGYVSQEVFLLDSTLAENVAFTKDLDEINYALVEESLSRASLKDFVATLEKGVRTHIGERGAKLSGGQCQRIGIARALYSGAQILVFDEATSALDTQTEEEITKSINRLAGDNLTMIIVAHRLSTLRFCNKIWALDGGIIEGEYSYEEILNKEQERLLY